MPTLLCELRTRRHPWPHADIRLARRHRPAGGHRDARRCSSSGESRCCTRTWQRSWIARWDAGYVLRCSRISSTCQSTYGQCLERAGASLATSYYSDDPAEHSGITRRPSLARTRANIEEAVRRHIPLRAGVIEMHQGQRSAAAVTELTGLGVDEVGVDRLRGVGRGARVHQPDLSELCGRCASGVIAISPDGEVWPCVFARWLPVGNVLDSDLVDILAGPAVKRVRSALQAGFDLTPPATPCVPTMCDPQCGPSCSPACRPAGDCRPAGGCVPWY